MAGGRPVEIYGLYEPSGRLRYIGKANDSEKRLKSHLADSKRRNTPVYCWIKSLLSKGQAPTVKVLIVVASADWQSEEKRLIALHRDAGEHLLNVAEGGDEPFCSEETRSQNAKSLNDRLAKNPKMRRLRELKRALMTSARQGHLSEETRKKCRELGFRRPDLFACFTKL